MIGSFCVQTAFASTFGLVALPESGVSKIMLPVGSSLRRSKLCKVKGLASPRAGSVKTFDGVIGKSTVVMALSMLCRAALLLSKSSPPPNGKSPSWK